MRKLEKMLRTGLQKLELRRLPEDYTAAAAVLIPLVRRSGEACLLLTKRTHTVATHKGQVSFPGGLREEQDASLQMTALRETEEELGLPASRVRVLGTLHQYRAITNWLVVPYVGLVRGRPILRPNPQEVARVLQVPIRFFLETEPRREYYPRVGGRGTLYFYEYEGETIWGLTAAMIKDLTDLLRGAESA